MSFSGMLRRVKESTVYKLTKDGEPFVLRIKVFNDRKYEELAKNCPIVNGEVNTEGINCYDWYDLTIKANPYDKEDSRSSFEGHPNAKAFVSKYFVSFPSGEMILDPTDNVWKTQDEIDNGYVVDVLPQSRIDDMFMKLNKIYLAAEMEAAQKAEAGA